MGIRACLAGQRVLFRTATEWVALLADAQRQGKLDEELARLERIPLLVCDEVGYIPFDPQAASLMFMLVSRRYERASMIVTSNKPFSAWGEIFGDDMAATAMVDRLIHHAEILSLKGDSYRLKDRDLGPRLHCPADYLRRARTLRVHPLDDARRPLRDPIQAANVTPSERTRTMTTLYISRLVKIAEQAAEANATAFDAASSALVATLTGDGLIHLYGSGHSVLPTQETYPRYGSYIGFNPLTDPRVMWHNVLGAGGVRELLWLERTEGYAEKFLDHQPLNPGDSIVIFGHSGRNASGIDTALYAKKRGLTVIAVTARANLDKPATHSSGKRLADAADIVIDTGAPIEDAIVPIEGWSRPVAGSSTVLAMMMMHELLAQTARKLSEKGVELPVFASPTIAGVTLHDTDLIYGQYRDRMIRAQAKHLDFFKERMRGGCQPIT